MVLVVVVVVMMMMEHCHLLRLQISMANKPLSHSQRWLRARRHGALAGEPVYDVTTGNHDYDAAGDDVTADYGAENLRYAGYHYDDYAAGRDSPNGTSTGCFPGDVTPATGIPCNVTTGDPVPSWGGAGSNWWALILIMFPVLTVFGNALVVMSVHREKTLQSVTNYFIVSLAVADIMVAVLVMPLAVYVEVWYGIVEFNVPLNTV